MTNLRFFLPDGTAAQIMKHRDTTVNPCDNFYRYVCGNFEVPEVDKSPEYLEAIKDMLLNTMIGLEAAITEYKPFQLIEELHDTCMNDSEFYFYGLSLIYKYTCIYGNFGTLITFRCSWTTGS